MIVINIHVIFNRPFLLHDLQAPDETFRCAIIPRSWSNLSREDYFLTSRSWRLFRLPGVVDTFDVSRSIDYRRSFIRWTLSPLSRYPRSLKTGILRETTAPYPLVVASPLIVDLNWAVSLHVWLRLTLDVGVYDIILSSPSASYDALVVVRLVT